MAIDKFTMLAPQGNDLPQPGDRYKHKNGETYTVVIVTNTHHHDPNHPPQVVYQGRNGHVWSRPLESWNTSMEIEL